MTRSFFLRPPSDTQHCFNECDQYEHLPGQDACSHLSKSNVEGDGGNMFSIYGDRESHRGRGRGEAFQYQILLTYHTKPFHIRRISPLNLYVDHNHLAVRFI